MPRPPLEVADILREHGASFLRTGPTGLTSHHRRTLEDLQACRTADLGGHVERCDRCDHEVVAYNSCRNRHCPKCGALAKERWLEQRQAELLPVAYFHVVFTVPEPIAAIALQNQRTVYDILFQAAAQTLKTIAADPKHLGAKIGFLAVLHSWGQSLEFHPHIHCVVPGGGPSPDGERWVACREGFFLPVRVLSRLFRRLFLKALERAHGRGDLRFGGQLQALKDRPAFQAHLAKARRMEWVVYAKPPFGGPKQVLDYLGRYTHRVAISNHRLVKLEDGRVTFQWRDYRDGNQQKLMTLEAHEFIRRFLLHVLPRGFVRLRHFGFMANRHRKAGLERCFRLLQATVPTPLEPRDWKGLLEDLTGISLDTCPRCKIGHMHRVATLQPSPRPARPAPLLLNSS